MAKYIVKRIFLAAFTLFVVMSVCLVLIRLLPVPSVTRLPGVDVTLQYKKLVAQGYLIELSDGTFVKAPIVTAYFKFWKNLFTGWNWGEGLTMYATKGVWEVVLTKLPYTVIVNLYSILFSVPLGLALGVFAALKKNGWQDHAVSTAVVMFISVPSYVYAFLAQYFLCYKFGWFSLQVEKSAPLFSGQTFLSMIPTVLSLSFGVVAGLTRYTRAEVADVLTSEYMLLARAKGLSKTQAVVRHALKNAMVVVFPIILGEFIGILSGSLIIEQIFGIPGVGALYVSSIQMRDYNFFMALTFFYTAIGLASGLIVDVSYGLIDPRIRMGSAK